MRLYLGRHVYGLAAFIFGIITLGWRDFTTWQQNIPRGVIVVYLVAALELVGGVAIQWPKTARAGAAALAIIYTVFALSWVPRIVKEPLVYDRWGNFFEQLSIVSGAMIVYAWTSRDDSGRPAKISRMGYLFFGISVISFTLEQLFLPFRDGFVRSQVDSSGTNVLGDYNHGCLCARGHCFACWTRCSSRLSVTHFDADRLRAAGMVADTFCRRPQTVQLGRQRTESRDNRSGLGRCRFSYQFGG